ncbi:MAG: YdcF family protein [Fibrobacteraceae bacterium]|nr:YdcF family protein [Fibrobacteraceae bacterium]
MSRILKPISEIRAEKHKVFIVTRVRLFCLVILLLAIFYVLVSYSGHWLVKDDTFDHVKWVVILDGQSADLERSDFAADLVTKGKADSVLILGRRVFRDRSNADFYAEDFVRSGDIDAGRVFIFRHDDPSTLEEAVSIIPWLKLHVPNDTVLLLTTAAATRRASFLFNKLSGGHPVFITADMHDWRYNADNWIFERESRKNWLREWAALANSKWDLWGVDTLPLDIKRMVSAIPWKDRGKAPKIVEIKAEKLMSIKDAIATQDSLAKETDK